MPSTVKTLLIHILPPETFSLNISEKVPKVCKIVVYFEVTSTRKKLLVVHQKQNKNVLLHVLSNLKICNLINPGFVAFLRLPLSIQKYLIAYYTFGIHKNCVYFSMGIRMKRRP